MFVVAFFLCRAPRRSPAPIGVALKNVGGSSYVGNPSTEGQIPRQYDYLKMV